MQLARICWMCSAMDGFGLVGDSTDWVADNEVTPVALVALTWLVCAATDRAVNMIQNMNFTFRTRLIMVMSRR